MQWIDSISDAELLDYLPQLVQVSNFADVESHCKHPCLGNKIWDKYIKIVDWNDYY